MYGGRKSRMKLTMVRYHEYKCRTVKMCFDGEARFIPLNACGCVVDA